MKAFPKDVTVKTMTTRHIGVENELGIDDYQVEQIYGELTKRGLSQSIGYDGGGREFRTNPISIKSLTQVRGSRFVSEYYEVLKNHTIVQESGGTHIHISILNTDHANMEVNAAALAVAFFPQFQKIAGRQSSWARSLPERNGFEFNTIEGIREGFAIRKVEGSRAYHMKGSMLNPSRHQTLEFRGPKGSNSYQEIMAWVQFLDNVVKLANRESVEGVTFKRLLRGKRISEYVKSLDGWRELTADDLNAKLNGAKLLIRR